MHVCYVHLFILFILNILNCRKKNYKYKSAGLENNWSPSKSSLELNKRQIAKQSNVTNSKNTRNNKKKFFNLKIKKNL